MCALRSLRTIQGTKARERDHRGEDDAAYWPKHRTPKVEGDRIASTDGCLDVREAEHNIDTREAVTPNLV